MNEYGTMHKVRTQYVAGLFELRICDGAKMVAVVGPRHHGSTRDRMTAGEVENLRQYANKKARQFEMIGYNVQYASTS